MPFEPPTAFLPEDRRTRIDPVIAFFEQGPDFWCKGVLKKEKLECMKSVMLRKGVWDLERFVLSVVTRVVGKSYNSIPNFNDDAETTYALLMQVLYETRQGLLLGEDKLLEVVAPRLEREVWNYLTSRVKQTVVATLAAILFVFQT